MLIAVLALCGVSIAMVFSATRDTELGDYAMRQATFALAGLIALFIATIIDYRQLSIVALPSFALFVISLVLVLLFGVTQGSGAQRWITIAGTPIQPTEPGRFLLIIFLAWYLSWFEDRMHRLPYLLGVLALVAGPLVLIYLQPDLGMSVAFAFLSTTLILVSGVRYRQLLALGFVGLALIPLLIVSLQGYMLARFCIFLPTGPDGHIIEPILQPMQILFSNLPTECLNPVANDAASYNVEQAMIAVGNGGWFGQGWLEGTQSQLRFLRVRHTDFIFSVIAEELGLVGAAAIIATLLFIVWRLLTIADQAPDKFGKLLATGVAALVFFQVVTNVGMNLRLMPVTGLTLPFVSAGGSSLISMMFAVGLAQSVAMRNRKLDY